MIHDEQTHNSKNDNVTSEPLQRARHVQTPGLISAVCAGRGGGVGDFHPRFSKVKMEAQKGKGIFIIAKLGFNPHLILSPEPFIFTIWSPSGVRQAGDLRYAKEAIYKLTFGVGFQ